MSTMVVEVYDALKDAGASEEKARKAAEAIANYDARFGEVKAELSDVRGDMKLLKSMTGFNLACSVGILFRLLAHPG
jgi:hypothetical protein